MLGLQGALACLSGYCRESLTNRISSCEGQRSRRLFSSSHRSCGSSPLSTRLEDGHGCSAYFRRGARRRRGGEPRARKVRGMSTRPPSRFCFFSLFPTIVCLDADSQRRCASQESSARSSRCVLALPLCGSCRPPYLLKLVLILSYAAHRASTSSCSPSSPEAPSCVPPPLSSPEPAHAHPPSPAVLPLAQHQSPAVAYRRRLYRPIHRRSEFIDCAGRRTCLLRLFRS